MKSLTNKFPYLPTLITGGAVLLSGSAGIARIPGCNPIGAGDSLSFDELAAIKMGAQNAA